MIVVVAAHDDGISGLEDLMDHANATLTEMVDEGAITADERARMVIGAWPRRRRDLLAPFERDEQFCDLKVEHCETNLVADAAWAAYEQDGNKEALANKHASFFRATFAPTLAGALARNSDAERSRAFSDRLESGLKQRLASQPQPINSLVETMVFAKVGAIDREFKKRRTNDPYHRPE